MSYLNNMFDINKVGVDGSRRELEPKLENDAPKADMPSKTTPAAPEFGPKDPPIYEKKKSMLKSSMSFSNLSLVPKIRGANQRLSRQVSRGSMLKLFNRTSDTEEAPMGSESMHAGQLEKRRQNLGNEGTKGNQSKNLSKQDAKLLRQQSNISTAITTLWNTAKRKSAEFEEVELEKEKKVIRLDNLKTLSGRVVGEGTDTEKVSQLWVLFALDPDEDEIGTVSSQFQDLKNQLKGGINAFYNGDIDVYRPSWEDENCVTQSNTMMEKTQTGGARASFFMR